MIPGNVLSDGLIQFGGTLRRRHATFGQRRGSAARPKYVLPIQQGIRRGGRDVRIMRRHVCDFPVALSLRGDADWPPGHSDLTPLDFFLWSYLKERFGLQDDSVLIKIENRNIFFTRSFKDLQINP